MKKRGRPPGTPAVGSREAFPVRLDVLSVDAVAAACGVTPRTVGGWLRAKHLRGRRVGRQWWVTKAALARWQARRTRGQQTRALTAGGMVTGTADAGRRRPVPVTVEPIDPTGAVCWFPEVEEPCTGAWVRLRVPLPRDGGQERAVETVACAAHRGAAEARLAAWVRAWWGAVAAAGVQRRLRATVGRRRGPRGGPEGRA